MNIHESEKIAGQLQELGYFATEDDKQADIFVFNTCCIRDNAEKKAMGNIGEIKHLKKLKPNLIVAIVGCMTQQDGAGLNLREKFPFIDIVLGTNNINLLKNCITDLINSRKKSVLIDTNEKPDINEDAQPYRTSGTNAWLNIMYGCNNFCTYCIVPYVRGRERSRNIDKIYEEFLMLVGQGYKEITLLGQNVNSYGNDLNDGTNFAQLLEKLAKVEGSHRIRFMTSHPKDLSKEIVDMIAKYPNLCKNIHLPIQSGSNKILKLMNRKYTREDYIKIADYIREVMPDCGITTDIMVGFPYEDEQDFEDTLDIIRRVEFSSAFTFVYSVRKGTPAATMPQIPPEISKARIQKLIAEQNSVTRQISKRHEGKTMRVLCEDISLKKPGFVNGRTDCGRLVNFEGDQSCIGNFYNIKITKSQSATLFGIIEE